MKFSFTRRSGNSKTGPIPTVMASRDTCPPSCELYNGGCYARGGMVRIHWDRTNREGMSLDELVEEIESIPPKQLWRYAVAGDLPGTEEELDGASLEKIVVANGGKRGFTYTHKNPTAADNGKHIAEANKNGFTINLSSNNAAQADTYLALGIAPVVTLMPGDMPQDWKHSETPGGQRIVRCPAEYRDEVSCSNCGGAGGALCSRSDRNYVIGFTAHGTAKKRVTAVAKKHLAIVD